MHADDFDSRLVQTGHYVGLKFAEGWLFLNVLETEQIELKPWLLLNENNNRAPISANTAGSEDDEFVDRVGRQLLEPQDNSKQICYQLLFGISPSRMQIYPWFGRDSSPNLVGGAEVDNPQVPFTGYDSPYNNPSTQAEIFTLNSVKDLSIQAYNPMDEPDEARVSVHVNKFKYSVVEDVNTMAKFIEGSLNFRDHAMGLAAKTNDQMEAPGWVMEHFGDLVHTTNEIINQSSTNQIANNTQSGNSQGGQLL